MNGLKGRLLTTLVGIPLILIILLANQMHHVLFALVLVIFNILAARELRNLCSKALDVKITFPYWLSAAFPIAQWLENAAGHQIPNLTHIILFVLLLIGFTLEIFQGAKEEKPFSSSLAKIGANTLLVIYPGYLISFLLRITEHPNESLLLILFFLCVFTNDIFAYVFGRLLGKNNKGFVKVSPNKSIAGFVGGFFMTIILAVLLCMLTDLKTVILPWQAVVLGIAMSITSNIGDLIESVFKRSAGEKDSGNLIPGRGGVLDSTDSIISSAPIFYLLLTLFLV